MIHALKMSLPINLASRHSPLTQPQTGIIRCSHAPSIRLPSPSCSLELSCLNPDTCLNPLPVNKSILTPSLVHLPNPPVHVAGYLPKVNYSVTSRRMRKTIVLTSRQLTSAKFQSQSHERLSIAKVALLMVGISWPRITSLPHLHQGRQVN